MVQALIHDTFKFGADTAWETTEQGSGLVTGRLGAMHLSVPMNDGAQYHNAQITNYQTKDDFNLKPPIQLKVTAYANLPADQLRGTAGFGFWNHAFRAGTPRIALPQALWFFFAGHDSNMSLAQGINGNGWKAATFDAQRWQFYAMLPLALPGFLLMRIPAFYKRFWRIGQQAIGVNEAIIPCKTLSQEHIYTINWYPDYAEFFVDDEKVMHTNSVPDSTLGFIAWMDNQYAIVTPQGQFGFGTVSFATEQTLVLRNIEIQSLDH